MNHAFSNGSYPKAGAPQRLPRTLKRSSLARRSSTWNRSLSWVAVTIAVFGLLVGGAVLDREQRLQLQEVIHG